MDTGCVTYRALTCRFAIQARKAAIGTFAATDLLNRGDAHRVLAARRLDRHLVADAMADQCLADRRLEADAAGLRVRLRRADDAIRLLVLAVFCKPHCVAHAHHALLRPWLDEDVVLDDRLQLLDPRLHHS